MEIEDFDDVYDESLDEETDVDDTVLALSSKQATTNYENAGETIP